MKQAELDFLALSLDDWKVINQYEMIYDKDGNSIKWTILMDMEYITSDEDPLKCPDGPSFL